MANPMDGRYEAMRKLAGEGWTLRAIGDEYGICRERVRQIIGNVGRERIRTALNKLKECLNQVLEMWSKGENFSAISRATGVPVSAIRTLHLPRNAARGVHGTMNCYTYHHCRCAECRAINAKKRRERQHHFHKNGLCIQCGKPSFGKWRCRRCADRYNAARLNHAINSRD